ncbi:MAG TPA: threonylcarbamoyl-AMP synthase [Firmicutes bacterium]|nr:threonylcarbamoyl-AMP synthase [Bacillota bacterium]
MKTIKLQAENPQDIARAGEILRKGGLVGIPTETVYGLAADALNGEAVKKIFQAKGRPMDNPLIVHISHIEQLQDLVAEIPESARELARRWWPGPLTMIFPKSARIPDEVSAGLPTVAVRFPAHPAARAVIDAAGTPLAAPSGNRSGRPSPTTAAHMLVDMDGRIDAIVDGGPCQVGVESTVITLATDPPRLLRPGGITLEQLREALGRVDMDEAVLNPLKEGEKAASPGMKYKHYAPKAHVIIVDGPYEAYCRFVNRHKGPGVAAMCYNGDEKALEVPAVCYGGREDYAEQARELFDALRELDEMGAQTVFARCPEPRGVGLAVYNRLIRAAGFEVLHIGE